MTSPADLLVVGAGPAGLAAAAAATESGATVRVVDAGTRPGGQYWRHGTGPVDRRLYHRWSAFARLRDRVARVPLLLGRPVRTVAPDGDGWAVTLADGEVLHAGRLVLATGAYDRHVPFPGWELPGVMAGGGVQALLKAHGVVAGRRVVVAGTGPFLLPVAAGLLAAGARVPLVAEANAPARLARHPWTVLPKLGEALGYAARLRTRYRQRAVVVRALGGDRLEAVEVARPGRPLWTVPCDVLAIGWGFTPQLELFLQLGCATATGTDGSLVVAAGADQATSVPGVWAAGESTGVGGADLALVEGEIAGRAAAGAPVPAALLRRRARLRRFADALHTTYPVPDTDPGDDTLACRCEEVPVRAVRDAVGQLGATDARTVKLLTRAGMGWCQGRVCGYGVARLTAQACDRPVTEADLRAYAERPIAVPTTLAQLADS
jgi:D-hydroxyproline dehydrogenase subunit alpha